MRGSYASASSRFQFLPVPRAGHTVADASPTQGGGAGSSCGYSLIFSAILAGPPFAPDTACVADIEPFDFDGATALVRAAMLTYLNVTYSNATSMWDA